LGLLGGSHRAPNFEGTPQKRFQILEPLVDSQAQALADHRPVDVLLVYFDHRINAPI
jgi:hypothetical protein